VYATGKHAVAIMGKSLSPTQLSKIILANPTKIDIMLDADAGDAAYEMSIVLGELFPTTLKLLEKGDPGDGAAQKDTIEHEYSLKEYLERRL